jgi:hypothetical protein
MPSQYFFQNIKPSMYILDQILTLFLNIEDSAYFLIDPIDVLLIYKLSSLQLELYPHDLLSYLSLNFLQIATNSSIPLFLLLTPALHQYTTTSA